MGLELKAGRDGKIIRRFYARAVVDGRRKSLAFPMRGNPPASGSLRDRGDVAFERSREKAEEALSRFTEEARQKGNAQHLTERLIEEKTGRKVEYTRLADLPERWRKLGRDNEPTEAWLSWCDTVFTRFAEAVPCEYLHEVTPEQTAAYVEGLRRNFTRRTADGAVSMLRSAFGRFLPPGAMNPFQNGISRRGRDTDGDTVHRRPFTADELATLFEAARGDDFLYPLVVTAACTGLRRGDVCRLQWNAVDLRTGFVTIKTAKTGETVTIPMFKPLREVIEAALAERDEDADFVFPEAASMIKHNPDGVTWRFKKLVADVMPDPAAETDAEEAAQEAAQGGERVPLADILPDVESAVAAKLEGAKRDRVLDTLRRYAAGASVRAIEKETKVARSTVSADLHLAEDVSGRRFMPDAVKGGGGAKERIARITRTEATGRARRASVLDWHALRTSWVTLALSAGVPVEVCRLVTGHRTVDVVMRHYFKPGAEALRTILGDKLPNVLTGNGHKPAALPPPKEEAPDRLAGIVAGLSENDRERLAAMLAAKG